MYIELFQENSPEIGYFQPDDTKTTIEYVGVGPIIVSNAYGNKTKKGEAHVAGYTRQLIPDNSDRSFYTRALKFGRAQAQIALPNRTKKSASVDELDGEAQLL